ncbi:MAG: inorganic phosphate transporter [Nitrosomonadales bacterium]|nr:MAG: inorganic phosphate transporter [Nitrosomonadales bacterium]
MGANTLSYRQALILAAAATVAGSIASLILAEELVQDFSGKDLVPDVVASAPLFILSVAMGAAITIFLATKLGLPVSTTHALIGGLVGAGLAQNEGIVHFDKPANTFMMSLLVGPIIAVILGMLAYRVFRMSPIEIDKDCACLVASTQVLVPGIDGTLISQFSTLSIILASNATCEPLKTPIRVFISRSMDRLHILSAMAICFARGANDTPKLTTLLLAAHLLQPASSVAMIGLAMAMGGLLFAKQVARTMSKRMTRMNHTQGLTANLITVSLVLVASKFDLPVSTTHVSAGSIAGISADAKTLDWKILRNILLSWVATLPFSAGIAWVMSSFM